MIETNNSVWIDRECGEDFFSSDICKVLIVNLNAGSSNKYVGLEYTDDPFFKLADVNDCVPISSLNQSWIRRNELRFYSSTYPWLYYAFAEYVHEGSYYLGVRNIKGQYSFLIRIVDDALISELNK